MQNNYIVFQCYGQEGVFLECGHALLSLALQYDNEVPADLQVWIYTDNPGWFKILDGINLPLNYRMVDKPTIQQWYGSINFVHRMKIELLKDFAGAREGNVLYCDTDVVFLRKPDEMFRAIGEGKKYMHVMEGKVSEKINPILAKLDKYLRRSVSMRVNDKPLHELAMWNAGVLGFSTNDKAILDEILAFTDREYPGFPKHVVEQFAFSVYFQQAGDVKAAAPYMIHYWNLKEARVALASFFGYFKGRGIEELKRYSQLVQIHVMMQEKMNFIHNRSIADKLMKKEWKPMQYDWKELMKEL